MAYDPTQFFLPDNTVNPDYNGFDASYTYQDAVNELAQKQAEGKVSQAQLQAIQANPALYNAAFNQRMGVPTGAMDYGTGFYMPEGKDAGRKAMLDYLNTLTKDQFLEAQRNAMSTAKVDKNAGFYSQYAKNPEQAWNEFKNSPNQAENIANTFWQWTPSGTWWQNTAGLGKPPDASEGLLDTLFVPAVKGALAAAGGAAGGAFLGPALGAAAGAGAGAGMTSGFIGGTQTGDPWGGMLKGGLTGGLTGAVAGGLSDLVGYNPAIADATWSEAATPLTSAGTNAGINALSGAAKGALSAGLGGRDPVTGALLGGTTSAVGSGVDYLTEGTPLSYLGNTLSGAAKGVTGALIGDKDPLTGLLYGGASGAGGDVSNTLAGLGLPNWLTGNIGSLAGGLLKGEVADYLRPDTPARTLTTGALAGATPTGTPALNNPASSGVSGVPSVAMTPANVAEKSAPVDLSRYMPEWGKLTPSGYAFNLLQG